MQCHWYNTETLKWCIDALLEMHERCKTSKPLQNNRRNNLKFAMLDGDRMSGTHGMDPLILRSWDCYQDCMNWNSIAVLEYRDRMLGICCREVQRKGTTQVRRWVKRNQRLWEELKMIQTCTPITKGKHATPAEPPNRGSNNLSDQPIKNQTSAAFVFSDHGQLSKNALNGAGMVSVLRIKTLPTFWARF